MVGDDDDEIDGKTFHPVSCLFLFPDLLIKGVAFLLPANASSIASLHGSMEWNVAAVRLRSMYPLNTATGLQWGGGGVNHLGATPCFRPREFASGTPPMVRSDGGGIGHR